MNQLDEAVTWERAAAGDGEAFGRLFDAHSGRVYRHALRLTSAVHDAEDVVAATFLELWRRRKDVRVVDGSVLAWLLVTAGNHALNQGRGLRRYRAFLDRLPRQEQQVEAAEAQALLRADLDSTRPYWRRSGLSPRPISSSSPSSPWRTTRSGQQPPPSA